MKKILILTITISLVFGCVKDDSKDSQIISSNDLIGRSITSSELDKQWLEQFRLSLLNKNASYTYNVDEAIYGIEALYNLLATNGVSQIGKQSIHTDSITISAPSGTLDNFQISQISEFVAESIKDNAITDTSELFMVDLNLNSQNNNIVIESTIISGELSDPDYESGFGFNCDQYAFADSVCFRSAFGNLDYDQPLTLGGPCDSPNSMTSAQEEIQKVIQNDIPRYTYGFKGRIESYIKYTDIEHVEFSLWGGELSEYLEMYGNCNSLELDYADDQGIVSEIEYNSDELNCTLCALKKYLIDNCPPGKVICDVDLWGDLLWEGEWVWRGTVNYCHATEYSLIAETLPEILGSGNGPADSLILSSNSIQ